MHPGTAPQPSQPLHLLQLTDTHLFADPLGEVYGIRTSESLARVLGQALASGPSPDALLLTGDVADDGSEAAYLRVRERLSPLGRPVYCVPGNHDEPRTMARVLGGGGFQVGGRASLGAWTLLLLDSHVPGEPHGRLGEAALARLEADLEAQADRHVLVAVHHPPVPLGSAWIDAMGLEDGEALLERLGRHPRACMVTSGHVHQAFAAPRARLQVFTSPSTCAQFAPGAADFELDVRPPGWRRWTLWPDGRIDTAVHWLDVDERPDRAGPA
jgi:Icc protein